MILLFIIIMVILCLWCPIIFRKTLYLISIFAISVIFFSCSSATRQINKNEHYYNDLFCDKVGGKREIRHYYNYHGKKSYVLVDCETEQYVYEGGRDKGSSLDSIQQVIFFSILTRKKPAIVIFNTDNKIGIYEYRIKKVADKLGIKFILDNP